MSRLASPNPATMTAEQKVVHDAIANGPRGGVRGPLAIWLHRPQLADTAQQLGKYCRYDTSLPPRLSELAILTTARIWNAAYEWQAHVPHALAAGLSQHIIDALADDIEPAFTNDDELIVYDLTRELNNTRALSDRTFNRAINCLGQDATIDLIGLLGYYSLISMTIKAFDVDPYPAAG